MNRLHPYFTKMLHSLPTLLSVILLICVPSGIRANPFQKGLDAYEAGQYPKATSYFEDDLETLETATGRHNLALCAYQSERPAEAVWQLERAMRIDPFNSEYRFKLNTIREQIGLLPHHSPWYGLILQALSPMQWSLIACISLWGSLAGWIYPSILKRKVGLSLKSCRGLCIACLILAVPALHSSRYDTNMGTLIAEQSIDLRAAPAKAAPPTGLARPGENARILDTHKDYHKIRTESGAIGWVPDRAFRRLLVK